MKQGVRLTAHAIERYIKRYQPIGEYSEIVEGLEALAAQAVPIRERSARGDRIFLANGVQFIVKYDRDTREAPIAVTILPPVREELDEVYE